MDTQSQDQQQKDFLSSLFPLDVPIDQHRGSLLEGQQQQPMFQFNNGLQLPNTGANMQPQLNMDLLGNLMSMQGVESQSQANNNGGIPTSPHQTQSQYNPQLLLEQQFKLTQLQQLQQLQNQIFQQQARKRFH